MAVTETTTDKLSAEECARLLNQLRAEVHKVLVGQDELLESMLIALVTGGHILLEGVPGLAKTTAVKAFAMSLGMKHCRISFTPDLLPADIVGTMVYNQATAAFSPHLGPVFTNILLADEINRAPAKVQSALLEAMQERHVTIGKETFALPEPFMVMATQNPIEQEGTYPLPEAQVDRFMLKCRIDYPSREDEQTISERFACRSKIELDPVLSPEQVSGIRDTVEHVHCSDKVNAYILDIVRATRQPSEYGMDIDHLIDYGASPRATLYINITSRALALLRGNSYVTPQEVKDICKQVLRHRIILSYEAEAETRTSEGIIDHILDNISVP